MATQLSLRFSFTNNFYDPNIEHSFDNKATITAVSFSGLNQLDSFISKSSSYVNRMYNFIKEISELNSSSIKKHGSLISKYEKAFLNNDTIPHDWNQNVHSPVIQLLKQKLKNETNFNKILENEVLYHLKNLQETNDRNLALNLKKLQKLRDEIVNSNQTLAKKSEKLKQLNVKLRECELNLQVGNGPGIGEKQLQKLIKEKQKQKEVIYNLQNDIYLITTRYEILIKNYRTSWIGITETIQNEQFNKFQFFLKLVNDNFVKGLDDFFSKGLHALESLKYKIIKYDFNKDLEWASYKFGSEYLNLTENKNEEDIINSEYKKNFKQINEESKQDISNHQQKRQILDFEDSTLDFENKDQHISLGFNETSIYQQKNIKKMSPSRKPVPTYQNFVSQDHDSGDNLSKATPQFGIVSNPYSNEIDFDETSSINLGLNYTTVQCVDKTILPSNHTLAQLQQKELPGIQNNYLGREADNINPNNTKIITENRPNELEVTMSDLTMAPLRQSSVSSGVITNNGSLKDISQTKFYENNSVQQSNSHNQSLESTAKSYFSDQDPIKDFLKSAGSIEGVNWRNRKTVIFQEKTPPSVPSREIDLFLSDDEYYQKNTSIGNDKNINERSEEIIHNSKLSDTEMVKIYSGLTHDDTNSNNEIKIDNTETRETESSTLVKEDFSAKQPHLLFTKPSKNHDLLKTEFAQKEPAKNKESGDLTILTEAVLKMKEKKQKRRSKMVLSDVSTAYSSLAPDTSPDMKVFVPHHH
ncbi:hypothetical protein QEN19_002698 [Hanseniaspora menglaensis]